MDQLQLFQTFITSIDKGSLSGAAKELGLSQPAVSQQITHLESILQKELLFRTSRGVQATEAGRVVYKNADIILSQVNKLSEELHNLDDSLSGSLRITAPLAIGQSLIAPIVFELQSKYPDFNIALNLSDHLIDLVKERIDIAIRVGSLGKANGLARKVGDLELMLVASPEFLDRHGRPQVPRDLANVPMIQYCGDKKFHNQTLYQGNQEFQAQVQATYTFDNPDVILSAVSRSLGYTKFPYLFVKDQLAKGELEQVLPAFTIPPKSIYLLYPSRQSLTRRAEVFIDRLLANIVTLDGVIPARGGKWRKSEASRLVDA